MASRGGSPRGCIVVDFNKQKGVKHSRPGGLVESIEQELTELLPGVWFRRDLKCHPRSCALYHRSAIIERITGNTGILVTIIAGGVKELLFIMIDEAEKVSHALIERVRDIALKTCEYLRAKHFEVRQLRFQFE